ncbi:ABC-type glutathione transport system ATPase component [Vogesella perlucida]|nr:ABC-type glutathione transport system ATPase component [Vogesella perlucida]
MPSSAISNGFMPPGAALRCDVRRAAEAAFLTESEYIMAELAIELIGVNKHFGEVHANKNITFGVRKGTVHGIIGENGAGQVHADEHHLRLLPSGLRHHQD